MKQAVTTRVGWIVVSAIVLFSVLGAEALTGWDAPVAGEITIQSSGLEPEVFLTEPELRVVFVNKTGRPIHIQFTMRDGGQHHLFQVPDRIWAIFHRPGRHPYVVHFGDPKTPNLHGAVDVAISPYGRPDPLVCAGITVMGGCLER